MNIYRKQYISEFTRKEMEGMKTLCCLHHGGGGTCSHHYEGKLLQRCRKQRLREPRVVLGNGKQEVMQSL